MGGEDLDLPDERKGEIKGICLGQLSEPALLLCARCEPGAFHILLCLKEGQPTEEETQVRDLIIPHICIVCYSFQHISHAFVIISDPATPL